MLNQQLGTDQKIPFTLVDKDSSGVQVPPQSGDVPSVTSSDTQSASIVFDGTPTPPGVAASGYVVAGNKLQVGVTITATITHGNGSPPFVDSKLIDIVPGTPASVSLVFGTPVPKP